MVSTSSSKLKTLPRALLVALLLALGVFVFMGAWVGVAVLSNGHAGWMVLLAALDAGVFLRMARMRPGRMRARLALLATIASIALGNWLVAALPIARAMGLFPLETAQRIGPDFGWMLIRLGNTPVDWLWMVAALVLAMWFGR